MLPLDSAPLPTPAPDVLYQALDDGAVLLAPATEVYFGLNHVGAAIWERLPPVCRTFGALCGALRDVYPDAPADGLAHDVAALLTSLREAGLVTPDPTA